jgi:hypothetical protein
MSVLQVRGGFPHVFNATIDTTGRAVRPKKETSWMQVQTTGNPVKIYFTERDFIAGTNFVTVPVPALQDITMWEGPVELGNDDEGPVCWMQGDGGNAVVQAIFYQRRG